MRGENRDYIPTRQKGVTDQTCDLSEGCAFKATSERVDRGAHFRRKEGKLNREERERAMYPSFFMTDGDY